MRVLTVLILSLLVAAPAFAEDAPADSTADSEAIGSSSVILPVLAYTPDTSLMIGGTFLRFFYLEDDPDLRPSVLAPVFIYTFDEQVLGFLGCELYWAGNKHRLAAVGSYKYFPDQIYGIGRDAPESAEEDYTPREVGFEAEYDRQIGGAARLGPGVRLVRHTLEETWLGGLMTTGAIPGAGEFTVTMPQIHAAWDSRDNTWAPRHGIYATLRFGWGRGWTGSDLDLEETFVDLRSYRPLGDRASLAFQASLTSLSGDVPYFLMPRLGGDQGLRGYPAGRYLDRTAAFARGEWRSGEIWGRLGVAAFAGIGDVAPRPGDLSFKGNLWSAGGGLRITLNRREQVKLRLDFGAGNGNGGFYLSLGEAF